MKIKFIEFKSEFSCESRDFQDLLFLVGMSRFNIIRCFESSASLNKVDTL